MITKGRVHLSGKVTFEDRQAFQPSKALPRVGGRLTGSEREGQHSWKVKR
jgi:hypothetical protein